MKILLSTIHNPWPWFRQTPAGDGRWGDLTFSVDESVEDPRWLVVYDEPSPGLKTSVPRQRRVLFVSEPPGMKAYPAAYLNQFGTVVSAFRPAGFRGHLVCRQPALPWHYGVNMQAGDRSATALGWEALACEKPKSRELSVICSNKVIVPHHRQRLAFVERLKSRLGSRVDVYGRGFAEIGDKADAIAAYKYHIVLENNVIDNFWTEKLADAFIGDSYPIFSGCRNIGEYFNLDGLAQIDIADADGAIDRIEAVLASDPWAKSRDAIRENRHLVMHKYNVFAEIERMISDAEPAVRDAPRERRPVSISQSSRMGLRNTVRRAVRYARWLPGHKLQQWIPEESRIRWKLRLKSGNPALLVDFRDRLGAVARAKGYHSQRGQDYVVDRIFRGKKAGFFVDVGANHPTAISNTWYFEQQGWHGLAFEPQERLRELFRQHRRTEVLPYVLGPEDGEVEFTTVESDGWQHALSGVSDVVELAVPALENQKVSVARMRMRRLDDVLLERGITRVDFMSIDVEGFEMQVLQGLDLRRIDVEVLVIENDRTPYGDQQIRDHLAAYGYRQVARLSGDDVFRRRPGRRRRGERIG